MIISHALSKDDQLPIFFLFALCQRSKSLSGRTPSPLRAAGELRHGRSAHLRSACGGDARHENGVRATADRRRGHEGLSEGEERGR